MAGGGFTIGDWCWFTRQASPCRVIERQDVWGEVAYRVWLPAKDAVVRARSVDLASLESVRPSVEQILHTTAAAKLLDALEDNLLLAPIQSSVVPLPHQLYALNRAISRDRIRYLLADEVGLGKTIEAGLVLRELKLRGRVKRILVVAPKGLVRQWQAEMRLHFGEKFQFIEPSELAAFRQWRSGAGEEENLWRMHDQVICSLDSVKPLEGRRGWSLEQLNTYNRERFEEPDLGVVGSGHHRRSPPHGRQHRAGGPLQAGRGAGGSLTLSVAAVGHAAPGQDRPVHAADAVAGPRSLPGREQRQP